MWENFEGFKKHLRDDIGVSFEESTENGTRLILLRQRIANSTELTIIIDFSRNESNVVPVVIGDIAHIDSPLKKEEFLKLINEVNEEYNILKMYVVSDSDAVRAQLTFFVHDESDYDDIVMVFIGTIRSIEGEIYKKFMRLQWS